MRLILCVLFFSSLAVADKTTKGYKVTCQGDPETFKALRCEEEFFVGSTDDEKFAYRVPKKLNSKGEGQDFLKYVDDFIERRMKHHKKKEKIK